MEELNEALLNTENAFAQTINYFMDKMILACEQVEKAHMDILPSPFLSAVIDNCIQQGKDVTVGGAVYNFSGIQMIQVANLADSLAAIKLLVYEEKRILKAELVQALQNNFAGDEIIRIISLNVHRNIAIIAEFITSIYPEVKYELLNYNPLAKGEYHLVDREYCFAENPRMYTVEEMNEFREVARNGGVKNLIIEV